VTPSRPLRRHELHELAAIYQARGLSEELAMRVAVELSEKDVIRAHARDELGIDIDEMSNPLQASVVSAFAFVCGALIPLVAAIICRHYSFRVVAVAVASMVGLLLFGAVGATLGGAHKVRGALRVLVGGGLAMGVTYGVGRAFGAQIG
jgi:vacuolar iron transporter family protein